MPPRLLVHLDTDRLPGLATRVAALDAGVEEVIAYGGVGVADVRELVLGLLFARRPDELRTSAIAVTGTDVLTAEEILIAADEAFLGPLRVSLLLDPRAANTTAAAVVVRLAQDGRLRGRRALILGGAGPVGVRIGGLLARAGAEVIVASRHGGRAKESAGRIRARLGLDAGWAQVRDDRGLRKVLNGVNILINASAAGIQTVRRSAWLDAADLEALVDVNAVPPPGIEGLSPADDGQAREGRRCYGALTVGMLRAALQRRCLTRLFERNDLVLDAEEIYDLARSVAILGADAPVPAALTHPDSVDIIVDEASDDGAAPSPAGEPGAEATPDAAAEAADAPEPTSEALPADDQPAPTDTAVLPPRSGDG